jgi:hypothetical protein
LKIRLKKLLEDILFTKLIIPTSKEGYKDAL